MIATNKVVIKIDATINAPVKTVWEIWSEPEHIQNWCVAIDDWHAPKAENDLKKDGKFSTRMEAKDGSFGYDFGGVYDEVKKPSFIAYTLGDNRKVEITFKEVEKQTHISQVFEAEHENAVEQQMFGWQSILNNFKKYTESITHANK